MDANNITEDYVSFETAQLLKQKGFAVPVRTFYNPKYRGEKVSDGTALINYNADPEDGSVLCSAPTLQMAMKWMREVHGLFIQIKPSFCIKKIEYEAEIMSFQKKWTVVELVKYDTYEEIAEAAIKHCLTKMEDK